MSTPLPIPWHIDRYRIDAVLGVGGFGVTYRATDTTLGRIVALKEHVPPGSVRQHDGVVTGGIDDPKWGVQRFIEESRRAASLNHPAVVKVHDVIVANGTAYLVMEYLSGPSLEDLVRDRGPLGARDLADLAAGLGAGLSYLHAGDLLTGRLPVLHLDISPSNVICTRTSAGVLQPILIDFGSSRSSSPAATGQYTRVVKDGFSAPELYNEHSPRSAQADVFSLAATLLYCACAMPPPSIGMGSHAVASAKDRRPELSNGFFAAVERGLEPDTHHRFETIAEFVSAMSGGFGVTTPLQPPRSPAQLRTHLLDNGGSSNTHPAPVRSIAVPTSRQRRGLIAGVMAVLFAVVVGGVVVSIRMSESRGGPPSTMRAAGETSVGSPASPPSSVEMPPSAPVTSPEDAFRSYYAKLNAGDTSGAFKMQSGDFGRRITETDLANWMRDKVSSAEVLGVSCTSTDLVARCNANMRFNLWAGGASVEKTAVTLRVVDGAWTFNEYDVLSSQRVRQ